MQPAIPTQALLLYHRMSPMLLNHLAYPRRLLIFPGIQFKIHIYTDMCYGNRDLTVTKGEIWH